MGVDHSAASCSNISKSLAVKKSNRLNQSFLYGEDSFGEIIQQECSYYVYRFYLTCLLLAQKSGNNTINISLDELPTLFGIKRAYTRDCVSALSDATAMRVIIAEGKNKFTSIAVFPKVRVDLDSKTIDVTISPDVLAAQERLDRGYTMVLLNSVNNCNRSLYAVRLYEMCKQYSNIGSIVINDVHEFLKKIGFTDLKGWRQRHLEKWIEIVNRGTELNLTLEVNAVNRMNKILTIRISKKKQSECEGLNRSFVSSDIFFQLSDCNISMRECQSIADVALEVFPPTYDASGDIDLNRNARDFRIRSNIELMKINVVKGMEIKNKVAWLKTAILSDYASQV